MADNNYSLSVVLSSHTNGTSIDNLSKLTDSGYFEVHTVSPPYGISAVNITALSVSGSNNGMSFVISAGTTWANAALPMKILWTGAAATPATIPQFYLTATNISTNDFDCDGSYIIYATAAGVLSAGIDAGTLSDGLKGSSIYTVLLQGDVPGLPSFDRHRILYNEEGY